MTFMQASRETRQRRVPRQGRSMMTVDAILQSAAMLLVRDGFSRASTTRIAEHAGVSIGSFYEYFPNKDAVIAQLISQHCDSMLVSISQRLAAVDSQSALPVLETFIEATYDAYADNIDLQRILLEHVGRVSKPHHFKRVSDAIIAMLEAALEQFSQEVPRDNLRLILYVIECFVESLVHRTIIFDQAFFDGQLKRELLSLTAAYLNHHQHLSGSPC